MAEVTPERSIRRPRAWVLTIRCAALGQLSIPALINGEKTGRRTKSATRFLWKIPEFYRLAVTLTPNWFGSCSGAFLAPAMSVAIGSGAPGSTLISMLRGSSR